MVMMFVACDSMIKLIIHVPYFFNYKTEVFFSFQNNPKNLDPLQKER